MAYSWITPKTNWQSGDYCTYVDINRIWNNLLYLYDAIGVTPPHPTMTPTLTVTASLTVSGYNRTQKEVYQLYGLLGCMGEYPFIFNKTQNSAPWSSTDLNTIESILLECKYIVDEGNYILNYVYAGAGMYCDNNDLI